MQYLFELLFARSVVYAANPSLNYVDSGVGQMGGIVSRAIPVLVALALLFFIWGVVRFISSSGDEKAAEEGKSKMVWGIIALFVIVSVWGLVAFLNDVTGVNQGESYQAPFSDF